MNCKMCGALKEEGSSFCPVCGAPYTARDKAFTTAASPNRITKPLKTSQFFLYKILKAIPIVNLVVFLVWAFCSDVNLNKKSYARAQLLWYVIGLAAIIIIAIILMIFTPLLQYIRDFDLNAVPDPFR